MPARKTDSGDEGFFGVIAIKAFPKVGTGNSDINVFDPKYQRRFVQTLRINFTSRSSAYAHCDKLQDEIDGDCDPARAYVVDDEGMIIRAGRAAYLPANYFFSIHERAIRKRA